MSSLGSLAIVDGNSGVATGDSLSTPSMSTSTTSVITGQLEVVAGNSGVATGDSLSTLSISTSTTSVLMNGADNAEQLMFISAGLSLVILPEEDVEKSI